MNFVLLAYITHFKKGFKNVFNAQYLNLASEISTQLSEGQAFSFLMNNSGNSDIDSKVTVLQEVLIYGA